MLRNLATHGSSNTIYFLNEVLSLNAQEFIARRTRLRFAVILNEVLSLNAQEYECFCLFSCVFLSSMKS